jgi:hypothetical protein
MISIDLWSHVANNCYLGAIAISKHASSKAFINHAISKTRIRYATSLDGLP